MLIIKIFFLIWYFMINHSFGLKKLNNDPGISILKRNPAKIDKDPNPKHIRCSSFVNGTVLIASPPNSTHRYCTINVNNKIKMNKKLLKNPTNTFSSDDFSFLALISLKTCRRTKTLKKIAQCLPVSLFHSLAPIEDWKPKIYGPILNYYNTFEQNST